MCNKVENQFIVYRVQAVDKAFGNVVKHTKEFSNENDPQAIVKAREYCSALVLQYPDCTCQVTSGVYAKWEAEKALVP